MAKWWRIHLSTQQTQVWWLGREEDPWRRKWQANLAFLPGEPYGQRSLAGCSPWGRKVSDMTEQLNSKQRVLRPSSGNSRHLSFPSSGRVETLGALSQISFPWRWREQRRRMRSRNSGARHFRNQVLLPVLNGCVTLDKASFPYL